LYRKFKIKTVEGVDDFASMREVIYRRYKRLQDEKQTMPSLVLVDGGNTGCSGNAFSLVEIIGKEKYRYEVRNRTSPSSHSTGRTVPYPAVPLNSTLCLVQD